MSVFDSKPEAASFVADDNLLIQKPSLQAAASKRLSAPKTSLISQAVDSIHTHLIDLPTVVDPKAGYGFGMAMLTRTTELTPIKRTRSRGGVRISPHARWGSTPDDRHDLTIG